MAARRALIKHMRMRAEDRGANLRALLAAGHAVLREENVANRV